MSTWVTKYTVRYIDIFIIFDLLPVPLYEYIDISLRQIAVKHV